MKSDLILFAVTVESGYFELSGETENSWLNRKSKESEFEFELAWNSKKREHWELLRIIYTIIL